MRRLKVNPFLCRSHRKKKRKRRRGRKSPGTEGDKQEEDSEEEEGTPEKEGEIQEAKQTPEKEDNLKGIPEDDETSDKTSVKETLSDCAHSNASDGHKSVLEPVPEILHEAVSDENIVILGSVSTDKVGNNDCDARTAENIDTTETDSASAGEHKDSVICEKADDKNVQSKESVSDVRKSVRRSSVRKYSCEIKSVEPELLVDALENVMKVLTDKAHIDNDVIEETIREHMRHLDAPDSIKEEIEIIIMVKMLEMSQANEEAHKEAMSLAREQVAELTKAHAKSQDLRSPTKENVNQAHNEASATDSLVEEDFDLEEAYQEYLKTLPDKLGVEQAYWTNRPHDAYALNLQASASSSSLSQGDSELSWVESGYKQPGKLPGATASSKPRRVQKRGQKSKVCSYKNISEKPIKASKTKLLFHDLFAHIKTLKLSGFLCEDINVLACNGEYCRWRRWECWRWECWRWEETGNCHSLHQAMCCLPSLTVMSRSLGTPLLTPYPRTSLPSPG